MDQNITFMFYGLSVAWGILALFVVLLVLREKNLRQQMDSLRRMLDEKR